MSIAATILSLCIHVILCNIHTTQKSVDKARIAISLCRLFKETNTTEQWNYFSTCPFLILRFSTKTKKWSTNRKEIYIYISTNVIRTKTTVSWKPASILVTSRNTRFFVNIHDVYINTCAREQADERSPACKVRIGYVIDSMPARWQHDTRLHARFE